MPALNCVTLGVRTKFPSVRGVIVVVEEFPALSRAINLTLKVPFVRVAVCHVPKVAPLTGAVPVEMPTQADGEAPAP